ncbi:MAG TPA: DUF427 domain-containing protein [Burkholderiales bacterium]|jgi:uncharacterized protein (DUF427 family)|nr:DUF427 domain-containing protein [Burkholderiales bacterium]HVJ23188.1 DUF427 domain-containing protein [Burkholderiales bacterium]
MKIGPAGVRVRITFNGEVIADSRDALRLEEGKYAPVYYVPRKDVKMERLIRTSHTSHCPHKGDATYYSICNGQTARNAVWSYEQPLDGVAAIKDCLAFYPDKVDSIDCSGQ